MLRKNVLSLKERRNRRMDLRARTTSMEPTPSSIHQCLRLPIRSRRDRERRERRKLQWPTRPSEARSMYTIHSSSQGSTFYTRGSRPTLDGADSPRCPLPKVCALLENHGEVYESPADYVPTSRSTCEARTLDVVEKELPGGDLPGPDPLREGCDHKPHRPFTARRTQSLLAPQT